MDHLTLPVTESIKKLEQHEKNGFKDIAPGEIQALFSYMKKTTSQLITFRQTISSLVSERMK
jgi:hypothetical protein